MARNLASREQAQLGRLWSALEGEPVTYKHPEVGVSDQTSENIEVSRRATGGSFALSPGFRSSLKWQPIAIGAVCSAFVVAVLIGAAIIQLRVRQLKRQKKELEDEFDSVYSTQKRSPGGTVLTDPTVDGDRKLAHSAQMYHYQHQKQQMLAIEKGSDHTPSSEEGSSSDAEEGNFTVYECPGLAQPGKLEVDNPLYIGEATDPEPEEPANPSDADDGSDNTPTGDCSNQS